MLYPCNVMENLPRRARTHGSKYAMDTCALYVYYEGVRWYRIPHTEVSMNVQSDEVKRINGLLMEITYNHLDISSNFLIDVAFYDEDDQTVQQLFPRVREKYGEETLSKLWSYIDECLVVYRREMGKLNHE